MPYPELDPSVGTVVGSRWKSQRLSGAYVVACHHERGPQMGVTGYETARMLYKNCISTCLGIEENSQDRTVGHGLDGIF